MYRIDEKRTGEGGVWSAQVSNYEPTVPPIAITFVSRVTIKCAPKQSIKVPLPRSSTCSASPL